MEAGAEDYRVFHGAYHHRGTFCIHQAHLEQIHGLLDNGRVLELHRLADPIVGADADVVVGTFAPAEHGDRALPPGTSLPPLAQSRDVLVAVVHVDQLEAAPVEELPMELQAAALLA